VMFEFQTPFGITACERIAGFELSVVEDAAVSNAFRHHCM